jgi:pilus assembly protein CpaB
MKINNRFIFGVVSIALAAVIAFIALPVIARQTNGKAEIVRVVQQVRKGTVITLHDIEVVEVGAFNLPVNIARTEDDVVGKYATADLAAGDYILSSKVSFAPVSSDIQLSSIPSGKVAISLTVKSLASGLSDKLQTGDIVRIYHYLNGARDIPELQFVRILTVTDSKGVNVDYSVELTEDEEKRQSATITVLATPEQAKIITALENDGVAHVALICRDNEPLAEELLEMQEAIIKELYYPDPEDGDDEDIAMEEPKITPSLPENPDYNDAGKEE